MAVLNQKQREKPPMISKENNAKLALAMINRGGLSQEQKLTVIRKAHAMLASK